MKRQRTSYFLIIAICFIALFNIIGPINATSVKCKAVKTGKLRVIGEVTGNDDASVKITLATGNGSTDHTLEVDKTTNFSNTFDINVGEYGVTNIDFSTCSGTPYEVDKMSFSVEEDEITTIRFKLKYDNQYQLIGIDGGMLDKTSEDKINEKIEDFSNKMEKVSSTDAPAISSSAVSGTSLTSEMPKEKTRQISILSRTISIVSTILIIGAIAFSLYCIIGKKKK